MPVLGLEQVQFISEGYCQHANNKLGCRKKYADIGIGTTQFISEGYCQHAFKYMGCRKKYGDIGSRTNTFYFRRLLAKRVQLPVLQKEYAVIGTRTNAVYFRRLLATRVQLPVLQKKYADIGIRNNTVYFRWILATRVQQHSLFPNSTAKTRSTTWAAERNMPILGLEPTQFISECYCQHAFYYLGFRKKYTDIGTRTNTVQFRRLLLARRKLPWL